MALTGRRSGLEEWPLELSGLLTDTGNADRTGAIAAYGMTRRGEPDRRLIAPPGRSKPTIPAHFGCSTSAMTSTFVHLRPPATDQP